MNLMDIWNKVAKPAGNWVNDNVVQPTVNDFTDFGKGVAYAFTPQNTWDAVRTAINPNSINTDATLRNRLANEAPSPVSAERIATSGLGVLSTLAPLPGNKFVSSLASPLARVAAGSATRGAAAAVPSALRTYIETKDPYQALRSGAISGGTAGLLNVAMSPKATTQGLVQLWNKVAGSTAAPAAANAAAKVVSKAAPTFSVTDLSRRAAAGDDTPITVLYGRGGGGGTLVSDALKSTGISGGAKSYYVSDRTTGAIPNQYGEKYVEGKIRLRPITDVKNFNLDDDEVKKSLVKYGISKFPQDPVHPENSINFATQPDIVMASYAAELGKKGYQKTVNGESSQLAIIDSTAMNKAGKKSYNARQDYVSKEQTNGSGGIANRSAEQVPMENLILEAQKTGQWDKAVAAWKAMTPEQRVSTPAFIFPDRFGLKD